MVIRSNSVALALLILVCAIWGIGFVVTEHALGKLSTQALNALRFAIAALSLIPLWLSLRHKEPVDDWLGLARGGLSLGFLLFIAFYSQTEGLRFTSVSNAGFITGMLVPLVPLISWLGFRQKITRAGWIAVCLSTAGLYGLTGGADTALNKGDLLVLIGAIAFASHIVLTGHYAQKLPIVSLSILQMLAVSLYSLFASWLFDQDPSKTLFSLDPNHWLQLLSPDIIGAFLWMGLLSTAFGFWVQTSCQKTLEAHKVALVFAFEPIFAHVAGAIWLDERLGLLGWFGAAAIIAGMLIAELGDRKSAKLHPVDLVAAPDPITAPLAEPLPEPLPNEKSEH